MDDILAKVEEIYEETPNWVIWLTIAIGVLTVVGTLISSLCCSTSLTISRYDDVDVERDHQKQARKSSHQVVLCFYLDQTVQVKRR